MDQAPESQTADLPAEAFAPKPSPGILDLLGGVLGLQTVAPPAMAMPKMQKSRPLLAKMKPRPEPLEPAPPGPQTAAPQTSWRADVQHYTGGWAADTNLAVSGSHVVVTTRAVCGFYDRAGKLLWPVFALGQFFAPLNGGNPFGGFFDARALFDPFRKRLMIGGLDSGGERFLLAVSKTQNPLDGFHLHMWRGHAEATEVFTADQGVDYPCMGVDESSFIQSNMVGGVGFSGPYSHLVAYDAAELADGKPASGSHFWKLTNEDGSSAGILQPAVHHGSASRTFVVSRYGTDKLSVWGLSDAVGAAPKIERSTVKVAAFAGPLNGTQKGSKYTLRMTNLGNDCLKAVYRDGSLYAVTNDARSWGIKGKSFTSIRLLRLDVSAFPTIPDAGRIDRTFGSANAIEDSQDLRYHYGWPAVEVTADGTAHVVYTRTGETIFPQMRASQYLSGEPDIRHSRLIKAGEAPHEPSGYTDPTLDLPWGDCAGACVDPADEKFVWVAHQYTVPPAETPNPPSAVGASNYGIQVARLGPP